jgi:hypothetical protein
MKKEGKERGVVHKSATILQDMKNIRNSTS